MEATERLHEWQFIHDRAGNVWVDFNLEIAREQLRALWTAFCVRWNFDSNTFQYESCLSDLYDRLKAHDRTLTNEFSTFEEFNNYMGELIA